MRSNGRAFKSQRLRSPNQRMLKLAQLPLRSLLPSQLYLDHSHCLVLAPATLAALPSIRAISRSRRVLCLARRSLGEGGSLKPFAPFSASSVSSVVNQMAFDGCAFDDDLADFEPSRRGRERDRR